jgi:hypothetical protein
VQSAVDIECARLRPFFIILLLAGTQLCVADVIRLKNGRVITADSVTETENKVEYEIGESTFTIPRSMVERIETGGAAPVRAASRAPEVIFPTETLPDTGNLSATIIQNGRVDTEALSAAGANANPSVAARAYFLAATHEQANGSPARAKEYFERALSYEPERVVILEHYAALLLQTQQYAEAIRPAEAAARLAPQSADAHGLLGIAYSYTGRLKQAIASLKHSLELRPNPVVENHLAQLERDEKAESEFLEEGSSHFTLRFEGGQVSNSFRRELMDTLERHYNDLLNDLYVAPRETILVILYTQQAFFDVTQAPSWTGALNDGKLRIPVAGLGTVNNHLSRVLKHELAHTFIGQITKGRCPQWLNEGVAMMLEPSSTTSKGSRLAQLYGAGAQIPLSQLEGSFMRYSSGEATLAYAESLAAVEYLRDTYGMGDVVRMLERIGEGAAGEAALRGTIRSGYAGLEAEITQHLKRTYQ